MPRFDFIAFDADDTLWHNERIYHEAQTRFRDLVGRYCDPTTVLDRLYATEVRNLPDFGYGIKGFALSMIETAIELSAGRITAADVQSIIAIGRDMLGAEVELFENAGETVRALAKTHALMLVTKGDLYDQERKVARSGLRDCFRAVEVVSVKSPDSYRGLLSRHGVEAARFMMVGDSLRSDVLPVLEIGATAVYIPYSLVWAHEAAEAPPVGRSGFHQLSGIAELPSLVARLESAG